jgi:hypothetical protein
MRGFDVNVISANDTSGAVLLQHSRSKSGISFDPFAGEGNALDLRNSTRVGMVGTLTPKRINLVARQFWKVFTRRAGVFGGPWLTPLDAFQGCETMVSYIARGL